MEAHVVEITREIQLAVAPVFLLTAVGTLITVLNNRLGRNVDRRRVLEERVSVSSTSRSRELSADRSEDRAELELLFRRIRLIYAAIASAVAGALLVCLVVAAAFIGALLSVELARLVAILFVLAMVSLIACLSFFLREVFLAVTGGRIIRR